MNSDEDLIAIAYDEVGHVLVGVCNNLSVMWLELFKYCSETASDACRTSS